MPAWLLRTPEGDISVDRTCVIGRNADCEVPLSDPNASRRHAELSLDGPNVVVRDLESRNGTFVDGRLIGSPTTVTGDARIIIGGTVLTLFARPDRSKKVRTIPPASGRTPAPDSSATSTVVPDDAMLERAIAMLDAGKIDECAGWVSILVRRQSVRGRDALPAIVEALSTVLVALAKRTGDTRWLEGLFQVNTDCERLIAEPLVAVIETLAPPGSVRLLPAYLEKTSARAASLTPEQRLLLARLERLAG
jgi:pSer/pThr/pTyr-binding forkhead associated (FHA) protein